MSIETLGALCTPLALSVDAVGSRVTCNPPPTDTDADFLVLLARGTEPQYESELLAAGWEHDGSKPENSETQMGPGYWWSFSLWHEGTRVNVIATADLDWHTKFRLASDVAKALNLLMKWERITLFQAILYGNSPTPGFGTPCADPPFCQPIPVLSQGTEK